MGGGGGGLSLTRAPGARCPQSQQEQKDNSVTDTSRLSSIKQSLAQVRQEIKGMDLRVGVVAHALMQAQLKQKGDPQAAGADNSMLESEDESLEDSFEP